MQKLAKIWPAVLVSVTCGLHSACFGQIGATRQECINHYGTPLPLNSNCYVFVADGNLVDSFFENDLCVLLNYVPDHDKYTADEIAAILKNNSSPGQEWKQIATNAWLRSDNVIAGVDDKGLRPDLTLLLMKESALRTANRQVKSQSYPAMSVTDAAVARLLEFDFNKDKQNIFNAFHPTGTAKRIVVHECTIDWKTGKPTNNLENMSGYTVRFTIYWEGPVEKDGYTKISTSFDNEVKRYTESHVLATNGITNKDVSQAMIKFGTEFLKGMIQPQQ